MPRVDRVAGEEPRVPRREGGARPRHGGPVAQRRGPRRRVEDVVGAHPPRERDGRPCRAREPGDAGVPTPRARLDGAAGGRHPDGVLGPHVDEGRDVRGVAGDVRGEGDRRAAIEDPSGLDRERGHRGRNRVLTATSAVNAVTTAR